MAVTPLGNMVYVNQNAPTAAMQQSQHLAKNDGQAFVAIQNFNEKEKQVEEVRPTEETFKVDPDKEHEKHQHQREQQESEHKDPKNSKEEDEEAHNQITHGHLDIKI